MGNMLCVRPYTLGDFKHISKTIASVEISELTVMLIFSIVLKFVQELKGNILSMHCDAEFY
jgi:hypothetical protein